LIMGQLEKRQQTIFTAITASFAVIALCLGQFLVAGLAALLVVVLYNKTGYGLLTHPDEILYIIHYLRLKTPQIPRNITPNQHYTYNSLPKVSRSFAPVILGLTEELREPICLFYLVCRGLDTIEDDMKPSIEPKVTELRAFHAHLRESGWKLKGYGDKRDEIDLLENFDKVIDCLHNIKPKYFEIIAAVADEMGNGMADFLEKKVITMEDYNLYCWYVAGLVGEGLSKLFAVSDLEDCCFASVKNLYTSMGLFLQKTNITRDYLEDLQEQPPRVFYPKAIWGKYANDIADFKDPRNISNAVLCLNDMITDAMTHAAESLDYLHIIKDPSVFRFCAIPQVFFVLWLIISIFPFALPRKR
jgi:farnesyl-diphosphate farnesyltransferase